jgi:hypothetical protein
MALGMVMVLCLPFRQARAQCADQATIYALSTSIPYCAAAPCSGQTITFPMGCTDITGFTFEAIGGISVDLTTASTDGNGNFSVEVKPSPGNICKGRLVLRYNTLADNPCNIPGQYPALNMRFLDVYKQIPTSALSAIYAVKPNTTTPLGSPFHIQTETPPCVAQDERFNLSIYPVFESCLHDGIGLDEIVWGAPPDAGFTEVFKTEEGSSVTFRAPNANLPLTNEFSVYVGKYNAGLLGSPASANATVTLNRGIGRPAILAYSPNNAFNYLAQGNTENVAQACLPINRGGADLGSQGDRFTLQCVPDEEAAASYTWNIPSQFFLVNGSTVNDRVITVEARNRTGSEQGASGVFTCRVQATQSACGEDYAVMIIGRGLVAEEDGQPYNRITVNPMPTQGPNGLNCFSPSQDQEYTFTLEKAPINTLLQWNHTYATPPQNPTESYWLITGQPSQSQIRLRPVVVGNDLSIPLSVQAAGPCSSEVIEYKVGNEDPQVAGTTLEFSVFAE